LVHRGGVVDKRIADHCPWLAFKVGDPLVVSSRMLKSYDDAVGEYLLELIDRTQAYFSSGHDQNPNASDGV
jgi:hypothetical protein